MGKRHAWKGDEIYKGERIHILGIFEDLHRFFDDIPSRPTFRKGKETPYFGSHVPAPEDMSLPHPHLAFPPSGTGAALLVGRMEDDIEHDGDVLKAAHLDADSAAATASVKFASSLNGYNNRGGTTNSQYDQTMSSAFYDDISDIFPQHNEEKNGRVSRVDWATALRNVLGLDLPFISYQLRLAELEEDGSINYAKFLERYRIRMAEEHSSWQSGVIDTICEKLYRAVGGGTLKEAFAKFDVDGDHFIEYEEFMNALKSMEADRKVKRQ